MSSTAEVIGLIGVLDLWIAATGLSAVAMLQFGGQRLRAAAPFLGLAGQPAWVLTAIDGGHLGMLVVTTAYTVLWAVGCVRTVSLACKIVRGERSASEV